MATKGFKMIKTLQNRCDTNKGIVKLVELHEYNGKTFKFTFENSNGTPCGYDYKHSVSVFNKDADEWKQIGDKNDINAFASQPIDYANYFGNGTKLMNGARAFMEACKEYVKAIYG